MKIGRKYLTSCYVCYLMCVRPPASARSYLQCSVSLMLNGVEVISIGGRNGTGSSNSILLALNRRDEVWLQCMQGHLTESSDRYETLMRKQSN